MRSRRTQVWLMLVALLTALVGVINLLSAITPGIPNRVRWLEDFLALHN